MEKNLTNEIMEHFSSVKMGARIIKSIDREYLTLTLKNQEYYGVAIINKYNKEVNESFANVKLESKKIDLQGKIQSFLVLSSTKYEFSTSFAKICSDFVELGDNNEKRENISREPFKWWAKWKDLLGNVSVEKNVYSVVGEMWLYLQELKAGHNIEWTGPSRKNHDLEGDEYHLEVKSSLSQFNNVVTISNQFQLDSTKPLYLVLLKMQESKSGLNINDLLVELLEVGESREKIEKNLSKLGLPLGSGMRQKKYTILEGRKYKIDESFPIINAQSFVGGKIPKHVKKINYQVDLTSFDYDAVDISDQ